MVSWRCIYRYRAHAHGLGAVIGRGGARREGASRLAAAAAPAARAAGAGAVARRTFAGALVNTTADVPTVAAGGWTADNCGTGGWAASTTAVLETPANFESPVVALSTVAMAPESC